jgi:ABC-2 type transport system ATP-binding protein
MSRRLAPALVVIAAFLGTLAPLTPAHASPPVVRTFTVTPITVDVLTGPDTDITCTIAADLYVPAGASASHRVPAILQTNGFGGAKDDSGMVGSAIGFAQEGYAVLSYSGLGFGGSTCKISLDNPAYDGLAGKQMVSVLAGTKAYTDVATGAPVHVDFIATDGPKDPRVGMIGGSYGGQAQFAVAMQDPRVDALVPQITWNDLSYALAPNNTSFTTGVSHATPGVHKRVWTSGFFALGVANGVTGLESDPTRNVGCPNFLDEVCVAKAQMELLGYPDEATLEVARNSSVASYLDKISIPTLLVQGQQDTLFNLQEAMATYRGLRSRGVKTSMIWRSFGHSNGTPAPGEYADTVIGGSIRDTYLGRRYVAWMDRYVRGNAAVNPGPGFSYFRNWISYDTSAERAGIEVSRAYANRAAFSNRPSTTLALTGADALSMWVGPAMVGAGAATFASLLGLPSSYSETSVVESSLNNEVSDTPGTFAAYTTPPLAKAVALVGSPTLTLNLDAPVAEQSQLAGPAGQLVLFAKLYDVAPDGTETLQYRLISPVRVTDVTEPVVISLPAVVQRFAAGHRIRLVLAAGDLSYAGNDVEQVITVVTGPTTPSTLSLPLVGDLVF